MYKKYAVLADKILARSGELKGLTDSELKAKTEYFKEKLRQGETMESILVEAFAVVREASRRTLGMEHFKVQLIGGMALHDGMIAEMKTGEGKTLVATCPAYLNALSGKGVHIITANDYLSKVNKEQMSKIYNFLGLTVSCITADTPLFNRRELYACDIVYGTNKEFGFDYLRDNMIRNENQRMQRGFNYAIVDEADSVLIDEARTPLIISCPSNQKNELYEKANMIAAGLTRGEDKDSSFEDNDTDCDFLVNSQKNSIQLTDRGVEKVEKFFKIDSLGDIENTNISHCVMQAIRANHLMEDGKDYIVKDGEVIIVDNFTGRLMDGRRFNDGLHQAIEAKEKVEIKEETKTFATITLQNYFRMYSKLAGMTGTAATERKEFKQTYNMKVEVIPTNKPVIRVDWPDIIYKTEAEKFDAIAAVVKEMQFKGQPVLIGTNSILQSEKLSKLFKTNRIKHQVLNAKQYEREAEIIAQAGKSGTVTIATNMAGRGTDILLGGNPEFMAIRALKNAGYPHDKVNLAASVFPTDDEEVLKIREEYNSLYKEYKKSTDADHEKVVERGGLCVIGTDRADNVRVDNQLRGRAGRQGDPGMSRFYLATEDRLIDLFSYIDEDSKLEKPSCHKMVNDAQKRVEAQHYEIRKNVLEYDDIADIQRKKFYSARTAILSDKQLKDLMMSVCDDVVRITAAREVPNKKVTAAALRRLNEYITNMVGNSNQLISERESYKNTVAQMTEIFHSACDNKFTVLGDKANDLTKNVILSYMDKNWIEHLENIEALKRTTALTGYGNIKPIDKFKEDVYDAFVKMFDNIEEDMLYGFFHIRYRAGNHIARDTKKMSVAISSKELDDLHKLTEDLAIKSIESGKMVSQEEIKEKAAALARAHVMSNNSGRQTNEK